MSTLWHGRFSEKPSDELMAFTESLSFDRVLAEYDIEGSRAHSQMLREVGLLTAEEESAIQAALNQVESELDEESFVFVESDEDIHTAIERRVTEIAEAGGKLHTARSRNDQSATDTRLFVRNKSNEIIKRIKQLQKELLSRAESDGSVPMPGYTHMQRAQPISLAHHLLAHFWRLERDVARWRSVAESANKSVLGAGALAGTSLPIDPDRTAELLEFPRRFENSLDAVSDRDFVAEALFAAALLQVHLSSMGEEIVMWSTQEFGFITLSDQYATGSSMLPQKKNADIAELARGKAGRAIGNLTGFLATLKSLPLSYNRDLQEDKEALIDSFVTVILALPAVSGMIQTLTFHHDVMESATSTDTMAIDLADHLVVGGMPFREAHAYVGQLVQKAISSSQTLADIVAADPKFGEEFRSRLNPKSSLERRSSAGGSGSESVRSQIESAHRALLI